MLQVPPFLAICVLVFSSTLFAGTLTAESTLNEWQMRRLMQPSLSELKREQQGHVMIYDGLTDKAVVNAMNKHFDRIDAMMFTGVVITDDTGEPLRDPETGEVLTEDDGCD